MFETKSNRKTKWCSVTITTDWSWLIRMAWGNRRVSSRAAPGTKAYPATLSADWRMWIRWIWNSQIILRNIEQVVISGDSEGGHGARYAEELAENIRLQEFEKRKSDVASRIEALQAERLVARAQKDFVRADEIRNEIESVGFKVNDAALSTITAEKVKNG